MKAPSIIIGVGGIGSQVCARVEERLYTIRKQENRGSSEIEGTRFVVIDTDVNSLRELYRNGFRGKRILLTENMTVAKCRDIIADASVNEWYPQNTVFSKKSMTEGAGQQRSISRLAFEYCMRDGRLSQLDNVVRELNELVMDDSIQQPRFYIISSLAGGTGSGVILPLAMYINRFIQCEQGDNLAICKGFFILSSAFYASCESELEKKSLDANAYAAVKELSAFMRSSDDVASRQLSYPLPFFGDYSGATYEYCYLFGLTNARSKNIRSFEELKNIVADAVYMQACSPMHDRNSSREDNAVRHTTMLGQANQENWRRRFGGIGCGRLIYPYEELSNYLGLRWAKDTMEQEWRKYDEEYRKERRTLRKNRKGKQKSELLDQGMYYIKAVDRADALDWLAVCIKDECKNRNDMEPWKLYLNALKAEAEDEIDALWADNEKNNDEWKTYEEKLSQICTTDKVKNVAKKRYDAAKAVHMKWMKIQAGLETQKSILFMDRKLFQLHQWSPLEEDNGLRESYLEYWLLTEDGQFLHPNSVRYFLYQLEAELSLRKKEKEKKEDKDKGNSETFFKEKKREKLSLGEGKKLQEEFKNRMKSLKESLKDDLFENYLWECERYVKKLIKCYEEFYGSYDMILDEFSADIRTIEKKLDQVSGVSYSFVCADHVCRKKFHEELSERRGYEEESVSEVSYELYRLMHEIKLESSKMATRECADKIKRFWRKGIEREEIGKELLDMNILEAMNKEEEYHTGKRLEESGFEEKIQRVQDVLVAPFLQYFQKIDMNTGISLCCYHSKLKHMVGIYRNVVDWLNGHNAVDDDLYCSEREIMFYRSFVGLEVYEVLDYLHGISAETAVTGRAFQSYQNVLRYMGKGDHDGSKVITPHADTQWHNLYSMPDPSRIYQSEQEQCIAMALLYAWISGKIVHTGGVAAYCFNLSEREKKGFDRLYDCHMYLYGNSYWYTELYREMQENIREAQKRHVDCLEKIAMGRDLSVFDMIVQYQAELHYGECDEKQRQCLANAAWNIIYDCTERAYDKSREKKCFEAIAQQIDRTIEHIGSGEIRVQGNVGGGYNIKIDEALGKDISDFLNRFCNDWKRRVY